MQARKSFFFCSKDGEVAKFLTCATDSIRGTEIFPEDEMEITPHQAEEMPKTNSARLRERYEL